MFFRDKFCNLESDLMEKLFGPFFGERARAHNTLVFFGGKYGG